MLIEMFIVRRVQRKQPSRRVKRKHKSHSSSSSSSSSSQSNHSKSRQCSWPGCDALFRDKQDLQNHMWRHTGVKLYHCDWPGCGKRFSANGMVILLNQCHC